MEYSNSFWNVREIMSAQNLIFLFFASWNMEPILQNAPTQSLLSFVNGVLDEIIENKNGEIPYVGYSKAIQLVVSFHTWELWYILFCTSFVPLNKKITFFAQHIACLLRKVILEIERRISTQAEHIRNVSNTISYLYFRIILVVTLTCMAAK